MDMFRFKIFKKISFQLSCFQDITSILSQAMYLTTLDTSFSVLLVSAQNYVPSILYLIYFVTDVCK